MQVQLNFSLAVIHGNHVGDQILHTMIGKIKSMPSFILVGCSGSAELAVIHAVDQASQIMIDKIKVNA